VAFLIALYTDVIGLLLELKGTVKVLLFDIVTCKHTQRIADLGVVWFQESFLDV
jgi:hypothetical protein